MCAKVGDVHLWECRETRRVWGAFNDYMNEIGHQQRVNSYEEVYTIDNNGVISTITLHGVKNCSVCECVCDKPTKKMVDKQCINACFSFTPFTILYSDDSFFLMLALPRRTSF